MAAKKKQTKLRPFRTWLNKYQKSTQALMIFSPSYSGKDADRLSWINVTLGDCTRQITLEFDSGLDHYGDKLNRTDNKNSIEKARYIRDAMDRIIEALEEVRNADRKKTS